jgi:hypothetical protein
MRLRVTAASALGSLLLVAVAAAAPRVRPNLSTPDFFPLEVGNHWVYERSGATGSTTWEAQVTASAGSDHGHDYVLLSGYFPGPDRAVRAERSGLVAERLDGSWHDALWYMLRAPVGIPWRLELAPLPPVNPIADCIDGAWLHVRSRHETVRVPAGEFEDVVRVDFETRCADSGIVSEWFASGVGLIRREEQSFAGPVVSELVIAELGGGPLPAGVYSTALLLDAPVFVNNKMPGPALPEWPTVRGAIVVANAGEMPVELTFSGCKSVLVTLTDEAGNTVLTGQGDDGGCCTCRNPVTATIAKGALVLPFKLKLADSSGNPLPDGGYGLSAVLGSLGPPPLRPSATSRIEIRSVH